ncbi:MAG: M2 family metallopeptidase [Deltaproteobacteria bacterium]|nr:M2 family metallopeptidase [Deltaproteobacteria bacterium]
MSKLTATAGLLALLACPTTGEAKHRDPKTREGAKQFVTRTNSEIKELWIAQTRAEWVKSTYITDDTEALAAAANERVLGYLAEAIKEASRFDGLSLDPETARQLHILKTSVTLPPPTDPARQKELAGITAKLEGLYGKGKWCKTKDDCRDLGQLSEILATSRSFDEQLEAWNGWHTISPEMKPLFSRFVELSNGGAKDIGFSDVGALWKSSYDMSPTEFEAETDRLWTEVRPLYEQLHCYVRQKLSAHYGADKVAPLGPIPAHILGNMWAQEWQNVYGLVEPFPGQANLDVTAALKTKNPAPKEMTKIAEGFFTSVGLKSLPETFWERSMFVQPKDRDVVCHASAWDMNFGGGDLRLKMCIKIDEEDFTTLHHELGHIYYYLYYNHLPPLYQSGANDGFHEAIGDAIALSVTPGYYQKLGILGEVERTQEALINLQMKDALGLVAFLPFGRLIDQWRWDVFSGRVKPEQYNEAWWALRLKYQGIAPTGARPADAFDPGAKYHIPANTPYVRYFLAGLLKFQFHEAMCKAAGHQGPLHTCSVYGNTQAGKRLSAMLELGSSKPWREALNAMTGTPNMDAGPLLRYFEPLRAWLAEKNAGQKCGW